MHCNIVFKIVVVAVVLSGASLALPVPVSASGYHSDLSSQPFTDARDCGASLWTRDVSTRLHSSLNKGDEDHPLVPSGSHDLTTRSFDSFINKIKSIGKKKKKKRKKKEKQKDEPVDLEIGNHYANPADKFARRSPPSLTLIEDRGLGDIGGMVSKAYRKYRKSKDKSKIAPQPETAKWKAFWRSGRTSGYFDGPYKKPQFKASSSRIEERGLKIGEGELTPPGSQEKGIDSYLTATRSNAEKRGFKLDVLRKVAGGIAKNPKAAKVLTRIKSNRRLKHQHKPPENHWGDHPHHSIVNEPLPIKEAAKPYESIWGAHPQSIFSRRFNMVDQEERGLVTNLLKKAKSVVKHKKKPDPIRSRPDAVPVDRKSPWQGVTKIQNRPPRPLKFGRTSSSLRQLFDEEDRKRGLLKSSIKKVMVVNLLRHKDKKDGPDPIRSRPDAVPVDPHNPWSGVTKIKNPAPRPLIFDPTMITPGRGRLAAIPEKRGLLKATWKVLKIGNKKPRPPRLRSRPDAVPHDPNNIWHGVMSKWRNPGPPRPLKESWIGTVTTKFHNPPPRPLRQRDDVDEEELERRLFTKATKAAKAKVKMVKKVAKKIPRKKKEPPPRKKPLREPSMPSIPEKSVMKG